MIRQHIEINDFKLKYCIDGKGIPTLVIGSAIYYPRVFSKKLREHLKMAFIDHRGFGATDKIVNNSAFELNVLIDDIEHIRQALKFEKFIIIGHSGHGYMALEYAKRYPQHVSHVVLIGMGPNHSAENHAVANQHFEDMASAERKIQFQKDLEFITLADY